MSCSSSVVLLLAWLVAGSAAAQADAARGWTEPGTVYKPAEPPPVGACIGGNCATPRARERPTVPAPPRARAAYAGAVFGTASAGLVLASSIAIAIVDDVPSERVTRGLWLGYVAVATPLVALTAYLGRRGSTFRGYPRVRRLGWAAYSAAVVDGVLLWYGAFQAYSAPKALTIGAGAIGALALLPHALDALIASHDASFSRFRVMPSPSGVTVRF